MTVEWAIGRSAHERVIPTSEEDARAMHEAYPHIYRLLRREVTEWEDASHHEPATRLIRRLGGVA